MVDVKVDLLTPNHLFGQVAGGRLMLKGRLAKARVILLIETKDFGVGLDVMSWDKDMTYDLDSFVC